MCVCFRELNIRHRWKDLLKQLDEHKWMLANAVQTFSLLRDVELVSQELKELQVSVCFTHIAASQNGGSP